MEEKNTNKIAIALIIVGGLILLVFGSIFGTKALDILAEKEKAETLPTVTEKTEEAVDNAVTVETTDSKVKINIGKIENIENFNVENVIIKEKGRKINIDTITETE